MAISIIGTPQVANANNGGNATITWSTRPSENDYTFVVIGSPAATAAIGTISTTGYAVVTGASHTGAAAANPSLAIFWKKQGAVTDTTVVGTSGNSSDTDSSLIGFVLRGVDPTTFSDATPTTAGETTSTNPDPASITVATSGACVIVAACMTVLKDTAITAPSGYTGYSQVGDDAYDHTLAAAYKLNCSGTEAPASWTDWGSGLWFAITIAVRPITATQYTKNLADTINLSDVIAKSIKPVKADTVTLSDGIAKSFRLAKSDTVNLSDIFSRIISFVRLYEDTVTLSDGITKTVSIDLSDSISMSDSFASIRLLTLSLNDTINMSDEIVKSFKSSKSDAITLSDGIL